PEVQAQVLETHGDLYRPLDDGTPALAVSDGTIQIDSVVEAPYGIDFDLDTTPFTPADQWQYGSLGLGPYGA
ncbi:MAG: hypothetical protein R3236_11455, partial [Phycisphaeraceae bacterium]|nr:hypothetical protein [Phycisphaeraceae bacterium]